jgi:hypothetical protein
MGTQQLPSSGLPPQIISADEQPDRLVVSADSRRILKEGAARSVELAARGDHTTLRNCIDDVAFGFP